MKLSAAFVSLILGIIFGYLGQRARMCFIGGIRDYFLVKDTYLLKGLFSFFISAFLGFFIFHFLSSSLKTFPWIINGKTFLPIPGDPISSSSKIISHIILATVGGFGVGFFSVIAGGCPLRQHVMASEGSKSAISYLLGFYFGAIVFHKFIAPLIKRILT